MFPKKLKAEGEEEKAPAEGEEVDSKPAFLQTWFQVDFIDIEQFLDDDYCHSLCDDDIDWSLKEMKYYREEYKLLLINEAQEKKLYHSRRF